MSMTAREALYVKIMILFVGGAISLVALNAFRLNWQEAREENQTAREQFATIQGAAQSEGRLTRLEAQLASLEAELKVKAPKSLPEDQMVDFVKKIEAAGKAIKTKITGLGQSIEAAKTRKSRTKGTITSGGTVSFRLNFQTNQSGLVRFLALLRDAGLPTVITTLNVNTDAKQPDKLTVLLVFYTYLFDGTKK